MGVTPPFESYRRGFLFHGGDPASETCHLFLLRCRGPGRQSGHRPGIAQSDRGTWCGV